MKCDRYAPGLIAIAMDQTMVAVSTGTATVGSMVVYLSQYFDKQFALGSMITLRNGVIVNLTESISFCFCLFRLATTSSTSISLVMLCC